jgi:hypothetical protein
MLTPDKIQSTKNCELCILPSNKLFNLMNLLSFTILMVFVTLAKRDTSLSEDASDASKHVGMLTIY